MLLLSKPRVQHRRMDQPQTSTSKHQGCLEPPEGEATSGGRTEVQTVGSVIILGAGRRVFREEQGVLASEERQGKQKVSAARGLQERNGHHYPNQSWGSMWNEVDAPREKGDVRVRRECLRFMDDDMGCSIKRVGRDREQEMFKRSQEEPLATGTIT